MIILIALLGLLGMTSYSMELRVMEMGVRKVMGAGVMSSSESLLQECSASS